MRDIKQIAQTMGTDFVEAVKAAELADAEEIGSIVKTMADTYDLHMGKLADVKADRTQILSMMEKLSNRMKESFDHEADAQAYYENEMAGLTRRLEQYRAAKADGAGPQSNLDRPAKPNGALSDLGRG